MDNYFKSSLPTFKKELEEIIQVAKNEGYKWGNSITKLQELLFQEEGAIKGKDNSFTDGGIIL